MTVSAMYPSVASPGIVPTAATALAGATPIGNVGSSLPTGTALNSALTGAQTASPGLSSTAMQAAIEQLRAAGVSEASINQQLLAMQAGTGATPSAAASVAAPTAAATAHKATVAAKKKVTVKKKAAEPATPATPAAKAKAKKAKAAAAAKAKAVAAAKAKAATVATAGTVGATGAVGAAGAQLPANATALPGGTVYSYADANNPGLAGLAGLSPQQQLQLGIMPTGLGNGLSGIGAQADPQANITNQSNVNPMGVLGMTGLSGLAGIGGVPTIGAPISGNTNLSAPAAAAPGAPTANTTGGSQSVTNRNANDTGAFSQGVDPYGSMYGGYGSGFGGVGTMPYSPHNTGIAGGLYSPYGASMQGAALTGVENKGGIMGWIGRLFN